MRASTVAALLRLGSLASDHWERALQEILRVASDVLEVERLNYSRLREHPRSILCELGYLANGQRYECGFVLREDEV